MPAPAAAPVPVAAITLPKLAHPPEVLLMSSRRKSTCSDFVFASLAFCYAIYLLICAFCILESYS
jgi:hypothetical protein